MVSILTGLCAVLFFVASSLIGPKLQELKKRKKAFLVGTHRYSFQAGKPAEILGVKFITPDGYEPRACYHVRFEDGQEDFVQLNERAHFEIISEEDVQAGRIPEVVH